MARLRMIGGQAMRGLCVSDLYESDWRCEEMCLVRIRMRGTYPK